MTKLYSDVYEHGEIIVTKSFEDEKTLSINIEFTTTDSIDEIKKELEKIIKKYAI